MIRGKSTSIALFYVTIKKIDINQDKIIFKKNQIYFVKYFFVPKNCGIFAKRNHYWQEL